MITEDFVNFEVAKLLREKGFNEYTESCFVGKDWESPSPLTNSQLPDGRYSRPTLQMAMKWLREVHKITIGIVFKGDRIYYEIHQNNEFVFGVDTPKSYEKVCDEAIKYCLENLI
jgi:hypothetical protein